MKGVLFIFLLVFTKITLLNAQNIEFNLNVAPNLSVLPSFTNDIYVATTPIGDFVSLERPVNPYHFEGFQTYNSVQKSSSKIGYYMELELGLKLNDKFKLFFTAGINNLRYSYETKIDFGEDSSVNLNSLDSDYGNPSFLYLNLKPANLSTKFINNKLSILLGPTINYLINDNYSKVVIKYSGNYLYNEPNLKEIDRVYFERTGELNELFFGINSRVKYKISKSLSLFFSTQYYLTPIFNDKDDFRVRYQDTYVGRNFKPLFIQTGLSLNLLNLRSNFQL